MVADWLSPRRDAVEGDPHRRAVIVPFDTFARGAVSGAAPCRPSPRLAVASDSCLGHPDATHGIGPGRAGGRHGPCRVSARRRSGLTSAASRRRARLPPRTRWWPSERPCRTMCRRAGLASGSSGCHKRHPSPTRRVAIVASGGSRATMAPFAARSIRPGGRPAHRHGLESVGKGRAAGNSLALPPPSAPPALPPSILIPRPFA